jgi:hypothetical protein
MSGSHRLRRLEYAVGALAVIVSSIGVAFTVYSMDVLVFDIVDVVFWLLGPLGVYTVLYALWFKRDRLFYLYWGLVMVALALSSATYPLIHPLTIIGILLVVLVLIGFSAYRGRMR